MGRIPRPWPSLALSRQGIEAGRAMANGAIATAGIAEFDSLLFLRELFAETEGQI